MVQDMRRVPVIDMSRCVDCDACIEVCPAVFVKNEAGYIEVREVDDALIGCVQEAMNCCPRDCIAWEEGAD